MIDLRKKCYPIDDSALIGSSVWLVIRATASRVHLALAIAILVATDPMALGESAVASDELLVRAASIVIGDVEVHARASTDRSKVVLFRNDEEAGHSIDLPQEAGKVTELRLGSWLKGGGVSVVIEMTNDTTLRVSYFWAVALIGQEELTKPMSGLFLTSQVDLDVVGIANPESDSIYVVLANHRRESKDQAQVVRGYVYVNNCPMPGSKGTIYPFKTSQPALDSSPEGPPHIMHLEE